MTTILVITKFHVNFGIPQIHKYNHNLPEPITESSCHSYYILKKQSLKLSIHIH